VEERRGRSLRDHGAFWVLWACEAVLAAQAHLWWVHNHGKESREQVDLQGHGPCPELWNCCCLPFLAGSSSLRRTGGGKAQHGHLDELLGVVDNQKRVAKQCSGKMIWGRSQGARYLRSILPPVWLCRRECVGEQKVCSGTAAQQAGPWGRFREKMQLFALWIITFLIYCFIVCYLMGSGIFNFWVCRGAHLEDASSLFCP